MVRSLVTFFTTHHSRLTTHETHPLVSGEWAEPSLWFLPLTTNPSPLTYFTTHPSPLRFIDQLITSLRGCFFTARWRSMFRQ